MRTSELLDYVRRQQRNHWLGTIETVIEAVKVGELDVAMKDALNKRGRIGKKKA